MKRLFLWIALIVIANGCASSSPTDRRPADVPTYGASEQAGEIPVGVIPQANLRDATRGRDVELYIDYPTRGGPHPLILFSHAFAASGRTYVFLSAYWASHGYVVVRPRHADATREGTTTVSDDWENQTRSEWTNRVRDLTFIIDSLDTLEQQYPELQGKIDRDRIGVAGHSYGAFTAMLAGGTRTFTGGSASSLGDPRIKAVIAMSPQGPRESLGLTTASWAELRIPSLFVTGTHDRGATEDSGMEWRRRAFELAPAGDKWFVSLNGASQYTFAGRLTPPPVLTTQATPTTTETDPRTGRPVVRPTAPMVQSATGSPTFMRERQLFNVVRTVTVAFWDTYLKNEAKGREYLTKLSGRADMTVETK